MTYTSKIDGGPLVHAIVKIWPNHSSFGLSAKCGAYGSTLHLDLRRSGDPVTCEECRAPEKSERVGRS